MKQVITLVRGLPGSGKSTVAKTIISRNSQFKHWEADMFHLHPETGEYVFDVTKAAQAHTDCQERCYRFIKEGYSPVISNTFTQVWEMIPYFIMADALGIPVVILTATGDYGNVHNVPEEVIEMMRARWEYVTWYSASGQGICDRFKVQMYHCGIDEFITNFVD